ncbi:MAG TPA: hypothetical protein VIH75_19445 [Candidatus Sulfotelmatobacter sp.]
MSLGALTLTGESGAAAVMALMFSIQYAANRRPGNYVAGRSQQEPNSRYSSAGNNESPRIDWLQGLWMAQVDQFLASPGFAGEAKRWNRKQPPCRPGEENGQLLVPQGI